MQNMECLFVGEGIEIVRRIALHTSLAALVHTRQCRTKDWYQIYSKHDVSDGDNTTCPYFQMLHMLYLIQTHTSLGGR